MARLRQGEKEQTEVRVHRLVRRSYNGLREDEIAQLIGMDRRRLNNYLRSLRDDGKLYKEGRLWFAE